MTLRNVFLNSEHYILSWFLMFCILFCWLSLINVCTMNKDKIKKTSNFKLRSHCLSHGERFRWAYCEYGVSSHLHWAFWYILDNSCNLSQAFIWTHVMSWGSGWHSLYNSRWMSVELILKQNYYVLMSRTTNMWM